MVATILLQAQKIDAGLTNRLYRRGYCKYSRKMKVPFSDLTITAIAELSEEHPKIYHHVKLEYRIKMNEADKPKMERAIQLSEEKYCGVMAMFREFATIETTLEILAN